MPGLFDGTPLRAPRHLRSVRAAAQRLHVSSRYLGRVLRPQDQTAVVRLEKRRKGKIVTTVTGLDPVASDLESIARRLRTLCGAGGSVAEGVIQVQGEHRERVGGALRSMGYGVKVV